MECIANINNNAFADRVIISDPKDRIASVYLCALITLKLPIKGIVSGIHVTI